MCHAQGNAHERRSVVRGPLNSNPLNGLCDKVPETDATELMGRAWQTTVELLLWTPIPLIQRLQRFRIELNQIISAACV
jgi:hypothetical protein